MAGYRIVFHIGDGLTVETYAHKEENLLQVAQKSNVAIDAPCSGNGACGKCKIKLLSGRVSSVQTRHLSDEEYFEGWRLACCTHPESNLEVEVPDIASAYKRRMKVADLDSAAEVKVFTDAMKGMEEAGFALKNSMRLLDLVMTPPSLEDTRPDNERLSDAIREATGIAHVRIPYSVMKKMTHLMRVHDFHLKAVIRRTVKDIFVYDLLNPSEEVVIGGLAFDIGTTTVSGVLTDMQTGKILAKASSGNGQIRYGADVINRIIESMKPGGARRLQDAVIEETINPLIHQMCKAADFSPAHIYRMSIAGNTTMNHLLFGAEADPIRMEPYIPAFFKTNSLFASDIHLAIHPDAHIILAPNIGSYVGGDITAGTFVSRIWNREGISLFIDLGTNGELVLGNADFLVSCACSAGPAFEGGDISCGMRATDGAIEKITIDAKTMEPSWSVIGKEGQKPIGLCGSGIIDIISELFIKGIINARGKFIREGDRIRHDEYGMGSYCIAKKEDAGGIRDLTINEVDIDNFIRAKGAIFSAIRTMLEDLGLAVDLIDDVYVAGGIGSGINMQSAVNIGMLPEIPEEKFHYIGNSSLAGAYLMLLSTESEKKVYELAKNMTYLELSAIPSYMDEFVACNFLPHTDSRLFPGVKVQTPEE